MRYIEAPSQSNITGKALFLAGGITGCPDWQAEIVEMLRPLDITVFNPRRAEFPMDDPTAAEEQIKWEHRRLMSAHAILFWFPKETLCPITLYELGAHTMRYAYEKFGDQAIEIFIGVEPGYQRTQDVEIQSECADRTLRSSIVDSLEALVAQVRKWAP